MASCVGNIAGNIGLNCDSPIEGGYTGRGIYIPMEAMPVLTRNSDNPRIIRDISITSGAKVVAIDNEGIAPFDGSASTGNSDAGYARFTKTVVVRLPQRGADFAATVLEPLVKSGRGGIVILEKVDKVGDGSFEVIGAQTPVKCVDPSTFTRSETANGGAWTGTLQCTEQFAEVVLFETDYEHSLGAFESLLAQAF